MAADYVKLVKDKMDENKDLYSRMDTDRDLVNLSAYTLKDTDGKSIPHAVSITLNDPAYFAANVETSLNNATEQVTVETDNKSLDATYIEDFIKAAFASANSRLIRQGRFALNPVFDQQMCRRGRGAARCLFRISEGELITDITPWDTRYVLHAMSYKGLAWAAYNTWQSKSQVEAQDWAIEKSYTTTAKGVQVIDVWDTEHNEILIDNKIVYTQTHPYKVTPVCLQTVPMGSMLADKESLQYEGESIFFLIRDLIPELNRLVSIIQSLNMKALDAAMLWHGPAGEGGTPPDHDKLTAPGSITAADIGGGAEPVLYGELKRSAYLLHSMIESRIQRGSLSSTDLGTLNFPLSAVALIELGEGRDQVFLPRLGSRGLLKQQLAEMVIAQTILVGKSVEIGVTGHKRVFDIGKLEGDYEVNYKYFPKSPKIEAARYSMAAAAGNSIPEYAKRREILQREDPEEDERMLRWEQAELLSPAIKMNRTIKALLDMASRGDEDAEFEAELMAAEMGATLEQIIAGNTDLTPKPEASQKPQQMMPLMGSQAGGRGGGGGGRPLQTLSGEEGE